MADSMQDPAVMALDALRLRERAERCIADAVRVREIHDGVARRHRLLQGRLDEVRSRHRPDVWTSAAASRSRDVLEGELAFALWLAVVELAATLARLADAADELEHRARQHHRHADLIDVALAAAGSAVPPGG